MNDLSFALGRAHGFHNYIAVGELLQTAIVSTNNGMPMCMKWRRKKVWACDGADSGRKCVLKTPMPRTQGHNCVVGFHTQAFHGIEVRGFHGRGLLRSRLLIEPPRVFVFAPLIVFEPPCLCLLLQLVNPQRLCFDHLPHQVQLCLNPELVHIVSQGSARESTSGRKKQEHLHIVALLEFCERSGGCFEVIGRVACGRYRATTKIPTLQ